ncbi:MAG: DegT/DnrJ/EryC1/StrS aminotransferase [Parcubacteria group bacterium GW2011_GWA1_59_11]|nr:MAG: DegT/DnrJ/EryC1/StrS aminotransferase [Parcubacteria group bacterium GW2011_GWA1_59_11]
MIKLVKSSFHNERETKKKLADFILTAKTFSMDAQCAEFEKRFAAKQRRKHAVYVNSGSSANLILIQSLLNLGKLKKGDRVGFSALTWATNVMSLIQLGLVPVAIDCEIETLNISPRKLKEKIGQIDALFITNVLGFSDDIVGIARVCARHNILLYEDNCESLGSVVGGQLLGNFGGASTFSFYVGHHLSTVEGGMVCADSDELHDMLLMVRSHGWDRNLAPKVQTAQRTLHEISGFFSKYTFYDLGYNVRPTEVQGFIGNSQVGFWDEIVQKRQENFRSFEEAYNANDDFFGLKTAHMDTVSNFAMPVICKSEALFDTYRRRFERHGVEIRPIIAGDMTKQVFHKKYAVAGDECKNASRIHAQGFYFGNNPELTKKEVALLVTLLKK